MRSAGSTLAGSLMVRVSVVLCFSTSAPSSVKVPPNRCNVSQRSHDPAMNGLGSPFGSRSSIDEINEGFTFSSKVTVNESPFSSWNPSLVA